MLSTTKYYARNLTEGLADKARAVSYIPSRNPSENLLKHERKWSTDPKTVLKILHSFKELEISGGFISNEIATDGY